MLEELHITDFALIDEVLIQFGPGLNVLTGETGAGKTILLQALGLLLGGRADTAVIRQGARESRVEGRFRLADREIVVSRVLSSEGKSKCYVNGSIASAAALSELAAPLVDLHGQHEHQALLRPASHVEYLDRFCGPEQMRRRERWSALLGELRGLQRRHAELERLAAEAQRDGELLLFQTREIEAAQVREGEEAELRASLEVLRNGRRLAEMAMAAHQALEGEDETSGLQLLRQAVSALAGSSGIDRRLDELASRLESLGYELEEAARDLRGYAESIELDPQALAAAEERLHLLEDLKRKYGPTIEDVASYGARAARRLEELSVLEGELEGLRARRLALEDELSALGEELRESRKATATGFAKRVGIQLGALEMPRGRLIVSLEEREASNGDSYGASGRDEVEFLFSANGRASPRPLGKVASGGELSRLMLAAKVVLGEADRVRILVFDEIDAGVGGKTAHSVGEKLAELAKTHQIICVTHLPQIASKADYHMSVGKAEDGGSTRTFVVSLEGEERVAEIARMVSGATVTETSMRHAREMIENRERSVC